MFRHQLGDVAGWGLVKKRENRIIGTCGFTNWDPESKKTEIGYALARDHSIRPKSPFISVTGRASPPWTGTTNI